MTNWKDGLKTILITDDHAVIRRTLSEWLREEIPDLLVLEASSGESALNLLSNTPRPDLVLMDFHLPGKSGLDTTREIKSGKTQIPVIMLTIQEDQQYVSRALEAGANGYVIKRKMYSDLLPAIQEVLEARN